MIGSAVASLIWQLACPHSAKLLYKKGTYPLSHENRPGNSSERSFSLLLSCKLGRTTSSHREPLFDHPLLFAFDFLPSHNPTISVVCGKTTLDTTKLVLMASKSYNRGNREGQGEYHLMPRTSGQSLPTGDEDCRDAAIRCMEVEMEEMRKILVASNLKMPAHRVGEVSSKVRAVRREAAPQGGSKGKQALSYYDEAKSPNESQTVALDRHKVPPSRVDSGVDLRHALNAKQGKEGDLQAKLVMKAAAV
ncbi:hypothetical protein Acr_17g0005970 [Actinidia rufa]|uniref:Uncharacterized protein n=1 Tax=Actinidia rufa TaxID=165716 RepID=A0A7J0G2L6_9ERIC|nr:hypothetical protein Acr_17g0005970 [Actinidia rufa]